MYLFIHFTWHHCTGPTLRLLYQGPNSIDVPVKPYFVLLLEEVLHPFYIFELLATIFWCFTQYYYYAGEAKVTNSVNFVGVWLLDGRRRGPPYVIIVLFKRQNTAEKSILWVLKHLEGNELTVEMWWCNTVVQLNEYDHAFALETDGTYMYMYIITVLYVCTVM